MYTKCTKYHLVHKCLPLLLEVGPPSNILGASKERGEESKNKE